MAKPENGAAVVDVAAAGAAGAGALVIFKFPKQL